MRIWISGEVMQEVSANYLAASNRVCQILNSGLSGETYSLPIELWGVIGVLIPGAPVSQRHIPEFLPDKKKIFFRINLIYELFCAAESQVEREWIVFKMVLQSVELGRNVLKEHDSLSRFRADLLAIGEREGWIEDVSDDEN